MRHDHNDQEAKAFQTAYFQNIYPAASLYNEVNILKNFLSKTLGELESPTLTAPRRIKLLHRAQRLEQRISLILLNVEPTIVALRLFNQRMEALVNALTEMGTDITEEKLRTRLESLGLGVSHNEEPLQASSEPTEPAEAKVLEALQALSLTNTHGSSSSSTSSDAKLEKDEADKTGIGKSYQP